MKTAKSKTSSTTITYSWGISSTGATIPSRRSACSWLSKSPTPSKSTSSEETTKTAKSTSTSASETSAPKNLTKNPKTRILSSTGSTDYLIGCPWLPSPKIKFFASMEESEPLSKPSKTLKQSNDPLKSFMRFRMMSLNLCLIFCGPIPQKVTANWASVPTT